MFEALDQATVAAFDRRPRTDRLPPASAVSAYAQAIGVAPVHERLVRFAEAADRRLGSFLTANAFLVAVAGFSVDGGPSEISVGGIATGVAGLLAALAFVAALRGTTRRVYSAPLARDLDGDDIRQSWNAVQAKLAWSWLSSRTLLLAIALLGATSLLDAAAI